MFKGNIAQRLCANDLRHSWLIHRNGVIDIRQRVEPSKTGAGEGGSQEAGGAQMLAKDEIKRPARGAIQCALEAQLPITDLDDRGCTFSGCETRAALDQRMQAAKGGEGQGRGLRSEVRNKRACIGDGRVCVFVRVRRGKIPPGHEGRAQHPGAFADRRPTGMGQFGEDDIGNDLGASGKGRRLSISQRNQAGKPGVETLLSKSMTLLCQSAGEGGTHNEPSENARDRRGASAERAI